MALEAGWLLGIAWTYISLLLAVPIHIVAHRWWRPRLSVFMFEMGLSSVCLVLLYRLTRPGDPALFSFAALEWMFIVSGISAAVVFWLVSEPVWRRRSDSPALLPLSTLKTIGAIELVAAVLLALFGANIIRVDDQGFAVAAGALAVHLGGMTALGAGGSLSGNVVRAFVFHIPLFAYVGAIAMVI